jgi:hypothetical protein
MKKPLNEEFKRMQALAGINEIKVLKPTRLSNLDKWAYDDDHGVDIVFKSLPSDPNEMLTQYDQEYLDGDPENETFTKEFFWENEIIEFGRIHQGYDSGGVTHANKLPNETWVFGWDSGEISGFKEEKDFKFIPKKEL